MKVRDEYKILSNSKINKNDLYEIELEGNTKAIGGPGEFVEVDIPGFFLPRPISVAYKNNFGIDLIYKVVGDGTEKLSKMEVGDTLNVLTGCGNGYDLNVGAKKPLIIGGGTGVASIYYLTMKLLEQGINPTVVLGFRSVDDMFFIEDFKGSMLDKDNLIITLENQENSDKYKEYIKGHLVTDVIDGIDYDYFYACGPKPMLKAIDDKVKTDGEYSMESRMACGIGQCKCCSIETNDGMKTLCKDGPVLKKGLVRW